MTFPPALPTAKLLQRRSPKTKAAVAESGGAATKGQTRRSDTFLAGPQKQKQDDKTATAGTKRRRRTETETLRETASFLSSENFVFSDTESSDNTSTSNYTNSNKNSINENNIHEFDSPQQCFKNQENETMEYSEAEETQFAFQSNNGEEDWGAQDDGLNDSDDQMQDEEPVADEEQDEGTHMDQQDEDENPTNETQLEADEYLMPELEDNHEQEEDDEEVVSTQTNSNPAVLPEDQFEDQFDDEDDHDPAQASQNEHSAPTITQEEHLHQQSLQHQQPTPTRVPTPPPPKPLEQIEIINGRSFFRAFDGTELTQDSVAARRLRDPFADIDSKIQEYANQISSKLSQIAQEIRSFQAFAASTSTILREASANAKERLLGVSKKRSDAQEKARRLILSGGEDGLAAMLAGAESGARAVRFGDGVVDGSSAFRSYGTSENGCDSGETGGGPGAGSSNAAGDKDFCFKREMDAVCIQSKLESICVESQEVGAPDNGVQLKLE